MNILAVDGMLCPVSEQPSFPTPKISVWLDKNMVRWVIKRIDDFFKGKKESVDVHSIEDAIYRHFIAKIHGGFSVKEARKNTCAAYDTYTEAAIICAILNAAIRVNEAVICLRKEEENNE